MVVGDRDADHVTGTSTRTTVPPRAPGATRSVAARLAHEVRRRSAARDGLRLAGVGALRLGDPDARRRPPPARRGRRRAGPRRVTCERRRAPRRCAVPPGTRGRAADPRRARSRRVLDVERHSSPSAPGAREVGQRRPQPGRLEVRRVHADDRRAQRPHARRARPPPVSAAPSRCAGSSDPLGRGRQPHRRGRRAPAPGPSCRSPAIRRRSRSEASTRRCSSRSRS